VIPGIKGLRLELAVDTMFCCEILEQRNVGVLVSGTTQYVTRNVAEVPIAFLVNAPGLNHWVILEAPAGRAKLTPGTKSA